MFRDPAGRIFVVGLTTIALAWLGFAYQVRPGTSLPDLASLACLPIGVQVSVAGWGVESGIESRSMRPATVGIGLALLGSALVAWVLRSLTVFAIQAAVLLVASVSTALILRAFARWSSSGTSR